jgi:hypothetical protein
MKRRRRTPEQIIRKLTEGEKLLGERKPIEEVDRQPPIDRFRLELTGSRRLPIASTTLGPVGLPR